MKIAFCGVGALGSLTVTLCRNLGAELILIDFDRVESKNLLSQAFVKQSVGRRKAEALKLQLFNFYGVKAQALAVRLDAHNVEALCGSADLLVDTFDNVASRVVLSEYARAVGKPLLHGALSADGSFGLVRWDERFVPDAEDSEGQATCENGEFLPLIGLVCATLARTIQDFLVSGQRRDSMVSLASVVTTTGG